MRIQQSAILIISLMLVIANSTASAAAPAEQSLIQLVPTAASGTIEDAPTTESLALTPSMEMYGFAADMSTPPADLWERIRNGFAMAELNSKEVRSSENFYASRPEYINRIVERSKLLLFHIV